MGKKYKYIIELEEPEMFDERKFYQCTQMPWWAVSENIVENLTPYTEPDIRAITAYQKGLSDAWEAARKIAHCFLWGKYQEETGRSSVCAQDVLEHYSAQEAIEEIRAYEQAQKEKEEQEEKDSVTSEDVMRQYLDTFCKGSRCIECVLHTPDFTCGRGYHFLTHSRISNEEVRRAYAKVVKEK